MIAVAACILLAAGATATATPPQEKIEVRLRKKLPEGTQLEVRGSFVVTVDFLVKLGAVEGNPPAITLLRVDVAKSVGKIPPKLTTGFTVAEKVPAPPGTPMNPAAIAGRLRALGAAMPPRAWVEVYTETNGAIRIEGAATTPDLIADFMRALAADKRLKDLVLVSAERAPDGLSHRFVLTAAAPDPSR